MANKFLRIGGRSEKGYAKPFKTDESGSVHVVGSSEIVVFSKDNPIAPRVSADFKPRTTSQLTFWFPHLWTPMEQEGYSINDYRNIFEQTFVIKNTLDADLTLALRVSESANPELDTTLFTIQLGVLNAGGKMTITPEKGSYQGVDVVEVKELRQAYPCFQLTITPNSAPTTGEFKILNIRRY